MIKKKILLCLAMVFVAGFLSGCSIFDTIFGSGVSDEEFLARNGEAGKGDAVVVIMGNHANAIRPEADTIREELEPILENAITYSIDTRREDYCARINLSVIVCDGNPELVDLIKTTSTKQVEIKMNLTAKSVELLDMDIDDVLEDIYKVLGGDSLKANDSESDLHAAMVKACNILREKPGAADHIVIFDNGMVTTGNLNMNKLPMQSAGTPQEAVKALDASSKVDLSGIKVKFIGLGNTCERQINIKKDPTVSSWFLGFWEEYLRECKVIEPVSLSISELKGTPMMFIEDSENSYKPVDNVNFKMFELQDYVDDSEPTNDVFELDEEIIILNTTTLYFEPNEATFADQKKAESTLLSYESTFMKLRNNPDIKIYVVGSTAQDVPGQVTTNSDVSRKRADAIKKLICDTYDFPSEQVIPIDAGCQKFSWRNKVEFPDGTLGSKDEIAMQQNRIVAIIPSTAAEKVAELIKAGEITAD